MNDFDYLNEKDIYLDSACQSLRPRPVIEALNEYYTAHNSCGERVKYKWGRITDEKVEATREKVLDYLGFKSKNYTVSFTLNTTYGINLILSQLKPEFKKVFTSEIEHNSPFLSTIAFSKRLGIERVVMRRNDDGSIPIEDYDFTDSVVVVNCASNFDGRKLKNINELINKVHKQNGIIIIDAAQAMAHSADILHKTEPDAVCFSAHKLYAASLGVIIWKNTLANKIETSFIGGGMVDDVKQTTYQLSAESANHRYTLFESGLQAWGEIIALGAALDWLKKNQKSYQKTLNTLSEDLYEFLKSSPKVHMVNQAANPTMSFYVDGIDSHLLGEALSHQNIMARTGYFCAHCYLDHVCHFPPLIRFSLSYANTPADIEKVKQVLEKIIH